MSQSVSQKSIPRQTLAIATHYFAVQASSTSVISIFLAWYDATSNATVTLESTNKPEVEAALTSTAASDWSAESSVTITGPTATAIGSSITHVGNDGARRHRLVVVASAISDMEAWVHGKVGR